jgi:hypothetical protein
MLVDIDAGFHITERSELFWQAAVLLQIEAKHGFLHLLAIVENGRTKVVERRVESELGQVPEVSQTDVCEFKRPQITRGNLVFSAHVESPKNDRSQVDDEGYSAWNAPIVIKG